MGWDPWYMQDVDTGLSTCWPPEPSTWWTQAGLPTTVLGPVFTCPEAYYEAYTSTLDSHTTQTICCPSHYRLNVPDFARATFPSQCTSTVSAQQSLTWEDQFKIPETDGSTWSWTITSTVVPEGSTFTVFGWPVNGLNVVASSTAAPTSSTGSAATDATGSASTPSSTSNAATSSSGGSSNLGFNNWGHRWCSNWSVSCCTWSVLGVAEEACWETQGPGARTTKDDRSLQHAHHGIEIPEHPSVRAPRGQSAGRVECGKACL